jgi:putative SOS response-associated peptidase YedK
LAAIFLRRITGPTSRSSRFLIPITFPLPFFWKRCGRHPIYNRALFRVVNRYVGNLAPMPGVFPDYPAPVVRNAGTERELVLMRWGMPPPPRTGGPPVANIRNISSPHWRGWLKRESRCLVPFNSFAEYAPEPNPETKKKDVVWFAINDDRPLTCFAGIWTGMP